MNEQFAVMKLAEPEEHTLSYQEIMQAITHLYAASNKLTECNRRIDEGILDIFFPGDLADCWLECNKCRLYTEKLIYFEEALIPAMGLINDAKSMFESLVAWKLGMTRYGKINIQSCINGAIFDGIKPCIEELESWINDPMQQHMSHTCVLEQ